MKISGFRRGLGCGWVVTITSALFTLGCTIEKDSDVRLTHSSKRLAIDGLTEQEVVRKFGDGYELRIKDFEAPTYKVPVIPVGADRQFIYRRTMAHTLIYLRNNKVVLAIEEWSDY
jgi:hypothetical protein